MPRMKEKKIVLHLSFSSRCREVGLCTGVLVDPSPGERIGREAATTTTTTLPAGGNARRGCNLRAFRGWKPTPRHSTSEHGGLAKMTNAKRNAPATRRGNRGERIR